MEDLVQWALLYISRALLQYLWKCTSDNMKLFLEKIHGRIELTGEHCCHNFRHPLVKNSIHIRSGKGSVRSKNARQNQ